MNNTTYKLYISEEGSMFCVDIHRWVKGEKIVLCMQFDTQLIDMNVGKYFLSEE